MFGDVWECLERPQGQEYLPHQGTPLSRGEGFAPSWTEEEQLGLKDVYQGVDVIRGAGGPHVSQRERGATSAVVAQFSTPKPLGAYGEGAGSRLPEDITQAHGNVDRPDVLK